MSHETRQYLAEQLRGVDTAARTIDLIASDFSLDSYGTRIDPAGWDLEQFKKNGPICVQHDSYSRNGLPVAQAIGSTVRVTNGQLVMRCQFPPEGTDECADRCFALAATGVLRGVSVGFDPSEWEDTTEQLADGQQLTVRVYKKQRLMEVSLVTIPSNDNGLIQRAAKLGTDEKIIRKMTEQFEEKLNEEKARAEKRKVGTVDVEVRVMDLPELEKTLAEIEKFRSYFDKKQPANRESTKVLARFFEKVLKIEQPADEVEAWKRMAEAVEAMQDAEQKVEEKVEVKEEPVKPAEETKPNPPAPEAPAPERKASVQIPLSVLMDFPGKLVKSYTDAAAEALRQGVPIKDAIGMIDGMNDAVTTSISQSNNGSKGA